MPCLCVLFMTFLTPLGGWPITPPDPFARALAVQGTEASRTGRAEAGTFAAQPTVRPVPEAGESLPRAADDPPAPKGVDAAIERGLKFLQSTQGADGSWMGRASKDVAVTALSVLAFLSTGHVPGKGPYGASIEKGIRWVLAAQKEDGLIATETAHEMYAHGIATLMLAEALGKAQGKLAEPIKPALTRAVAVIVKAQRPQGIERGGWRYQARLVDGSDMSVTGWQLMALRAAANAGIEVPRQTWEDALGYVRRCRERHSGGFGYQPGLRVSATCTAGGIFGLLWAENGGAESPDVRQGAKYVLRSPLHEEQAQAYCAAYKGTLAVFLVGGETWAAYRPRFLETFLDWQRPNGQWRGRDAVTFSPSYATAMGLLAVSVEQQRLSIHRRSERAGKP